MEKSLYSIIESYQNGNAEAVLEILQKFDPLIKHYSNKFDHDREDVYADLRLELICMLKRIKLSDLSCFSDGVIVQYIQRTIKNKYIAISKKNAAQRCCTAIDDLNDYEKAHYERKSSTNDVYSSILLSDLYRSLNQNEILILNELYVKGRSVSEIGQILGKSRQAINQTKNHALEKLRNNWAL